METVKADDAAKLGTSPNHAYEIVLSIGIKLVRTLVCLAYIHVNNGMDLQGKALQNQLLDLSATFWPSY
jgi:hypothetical protein